MCLKASSAWLQVVRTDADVARIIALDAAAGRAVFDFTFVAAHPDDAHPDDGPAPEGSAPAPAEAGPPKSAKPLSKKEKKKAAAGDTLVDTIIMPVKGSV